MNEFDSVMSSQSDLELYIILNYKRDSYVTDALLSAEKEFQKRHFTPDQLSEFEQIIQSKRQRKNAQSEQKSDFLIKAKNLGNAFLPTEKDSAEKNIVSISLLLTVAYLFYFVRDFSLTLILLSHSTNWDLSALEHLLPFVIFPIGIYGLYKIKKHGWFIIVALLAYFSLVTI